MPHKTIFHRLLGIAFAFAASACGGDDSPGGDDRAPCAAGEPSCVCLPGGACADGLACIEQQCHAPRELGLAVINSDARSCEVVLARRTSRIVGASFGDAATGVHVQKGDHSALSFFANTDQRIPDFTMSLLVARSAEDDTSDIEVVLSRCFDRDGVELAGARVQLRH